MLNDMKRFSGNRDTTGQELGRVNMGNQVGRRPAYHRSPVGFPLHGPSAMSRHTLRNVEFQALYRYLRRDPKGRTGPPDDLRRFLHGVVYLVRTGIPWRDLPSRFGHWNRVFRRFRRWCRNGVWKRLLRALADARADLSRVHLDSSHVRSHVSAGGGAGGPQALGRSRGG